MRPGGAPAPKRINDLARTAKIDSLIIKSVSGHLTDQMKQHYSTVGDEEQRDAIGLVPSLVKTESVDLAKKTPSKPPSSK